MRLSLGYFLEKLDKTFPGVVLHGTPQDSSFSSVEILAAYEPSSKNSILYVDMDLGNPPSILDDSTIVAYSPRLPLFSNCTVIEVPESIEIIEVYKVLSRELAIWLEWVQKINRAIVRHADLQEIIDITKTFVSNPMYIADSSFKVIAVASEEMVEVSAIWNYQLRYGYLPYQVMQSLIETGELKLLNDTQRAFRIESKSFNLPFISRSIHRDNEHYGYFFIIELYEELTACDLEVAEYLGQLLSSAMYYEKSYFEISGFYHEHFFVDIIEGKLTDITLINNQLKPLHWEIEGDYLLFHIDARHDNEAIRHHIMAILGSSLGAQCLAYKESVLGILNNCSGRMEIILEQLSSLSRNFNRQVVLSEEFITFSELRFYYEQTCFGHSYLEKNAKSVGLVLYKDIFLRHINALIDASVPESRVVELLRAHDAEHNTDYCNTLYAWLVCDKNTVKAAQSLFIHRNTLIYRLEKINELVSFQTDSIDDQVRLVLSLHKQCAENAFSS